MTIDFNVGGSDGIFRKFEATNAPKGEGLAKEMMIFADKNSAAVSELEFQSMLKKIGTLSTDDMLKFIRSFDKKESIIELICDEIGSSKNDRKKACLDVLDTLIHRADMLGIEVNGLEKEFKTELNAQFSSAGLVNTKKLDQILNSLVQLIENRRNLTNEELEAINSMPNEIAYENTNRVFEEKLDRAFTSFGQRIDENGEWTKYDENGSLVNEHIEDGWASDTADFISKIWNNKLYGNEHGNTKSLVKKDLEIAHKELGELREAAKNGEETYKAKFKEIFGVDYDYKNIVAFQKVEQEYFNALLYDSMDKNFNRYFKTLLSKAPLSDEFETVSSTSTTGVIHSQSVLVATKEQVYQREFALLASYFGKEGIEYLNSEIAKAGLSEAKIEEKFEVLKKIAQEISQKNHNYANIMTKGESLEALEAKYENSYKAAYGYENDVIKRVDKYNKSQQTGAIAVKIGTVIAASYVAGHIGAGIASTAAVSAAAAGTTAAVSVHTAATLGSAIGASAMTFVGEVADDLTTTKAFEAWANGDLKALNDCVDWKGIVKQTATTGIMMVGYGVVARGAQILTASLSPAAQALSVGGLTFAFGVGSEYVMTGEISIQGVVISGVFALVAGGLQFYASNLTKQAEEAIKSQLQQDISNARNILGIGDDVEVTAEMLKSMKKEFALQLHPDKFGGQVPTTATGHTMGDINAAIDVLNRNLAGTHVDVNAGVAAAKAAASADDATMALTTTQTVDSGLEKAILSFARSAGVDKQVVTSTISKHPDVVNALVSKVAPDGTPMFTNKDIALILANSAEMLEKDKAMFMAVLNSEREMSFVASQNNRATAFRRATVDPLNETYYAVRGGKSTSPSATQTPGHASNEVIEQFVAARSTDDLARLVRNTSNVDDLDFIVRKLQSSEDNAIKSIVGDAINKKSILQGGPKTVEVSRGSASYTKVYDDNGNLVSITRKFDGEVMYHVEYDAQGKMIIPSNSADNVAPAVPASPVKPTKPVMIRPCELPKGMRHHDGNIGNVSVKIANGDMTTIKADAYLVPEFNSCASEGGVGGAVWYGGAQKGMLAYDKIIETQGVQEFGTVHFTNSGGGKSKTLIHAVTVGSGAENEFAVVQKAVYNALKEAEQQGITSIAMPELCTGIVGSLSHEQSAQAMLSAINQFSAEGGQMDVSLVIYGSPKGYDAFSSIIQNGSYTNVQASVGTKEFDLVAFTNGMANNGVDPALQVEAPVVANQGANLSTSPVVSTTNVNVTAAPRASKPISKQTLLATENPVDFNTATLQQWADDMGFTMTIEGKGSKIAIFKDSEGNMVRRITEDDFRPGKVYDDRIWYYKNGQQVAGKTKFHFNIYAQTYEIDASGSMTNLKKVYPQTVTTNSGQASIVEGNNVYPVHSEAPAAEIKPAVTNINQLVETGKLGQKALVTSDAVNPNEVIVTIFDDGIPSKTFKTTPGELSKHGISLNQSEINKFMKSSVKLTERCFNNTAAPSSYAYNNIVQFVDDLETFAMSDIKTAQSVEITTENGMNYRVVKDLKTGKIISKEETALFGAAISETYTTNNGFEVKVSKDQFTGSVFEKNIKNADGTQSLLVIYTEDGNIENYCVRHFGNDLSGKASYFAKYRSDGTLISERTIVPDQIENTTIEETRLYYPDGTVGRIEWDHANYTYYEISDYTNGREVIVPNYTEDVGQFIGLKRKSLFNTLPKF